MKVTCKRCGQSWKNNADYANRESCSDPLCAIEYARKKQEAFGEPAPDVDRLKLRQGIADAMQAAEQESKEPINLHNMPPLQHDPFCGCTVCDERRLNYHKDQEEMRKKHGKPIQVVKQESEGKQAPKVCQINLHTRFKEVEVDSVYSDDPNEDYMTLEVAKVHVLHIRPRGN